MPDDTTVGASRPDAHDDAAHEPSAGPAPTRGSSPWWWALAAVLAVLVVVAGGLAAWWGRDDHDQSQADQDRAAAATVAGQFALRMDEVDGSDFTSYVKSVNQLLTTKAKAKNDQTFKVLQQTYSAAKVKGQGKLVMTGVADSDADSATVLVVHDANVTTTQGDVQHHYRWTVDVVKVKGRWLVDDFSPVS